MKIDSINLKIIPDSRGNDTLEAEMVSEGISVSASVPSGKSKGKREAAVLVPAKALEKIDWIFSQIKETQFPTLDQFDNLLLTLDGTSNKERLGGNLILVLSIAFTKLLAKLGNLEIYELIAKLVGTRIEKMPFCFFNLIEGGTHAQNSLPFQEYLVIPQTSSPKESLEQVMIIIKGVGEQIQKKYGQLNIGDEGGYTIPSDDPLVGLEILQGETLRGTARGDLAKVGLDVAASTFFENGKYNVGGKLMERGELLDFYKQITADFDILSIEDPFDEEDFEGFENITQTLGEKVWIIADDLTTTNPLKIKEAEDKKAANAIIIKPNQIGSVSETLQAAKIAKSYGWKIIVSHRSGETLDTFISDLAVGLSADGLKAGCPLQKERLVKYQRLVEIERNL
ncbi:MAG: enolase C-terminal domain-like protein [Candidatus Daviesbacteria bacterium]